MELDFNGPSGTIQIAVMLLLGLGTIGYGAYSYTTQTSAMASTETVNATITATSVEQVAQRRGTAYRPKATFNYTVDGETYTSSNVYPGTLPREFGSEEAARSELEGMEPGDIVTAYVPQNSPGDAFLKKTSSNKPFIVMGIGVLVVLGSVYSVLRN